jgi:hypothetical protein
MINPSLLADLGISGFGLDQLGLEDREIVGQLTRQDRADREEAIRQSKIVKAALSGPDGERFLVWLAGKTVLRPSTDLELHVATVEQAALVAQRRTGQNQIFHMIVAALQMQDAEPLKGLEQ